MSTRLNSLRTAELTYPTTKPALLDRLAERIVLAQLRKLQTGQVVVIQDDVHATFGQLTDDFPKAIELRVFDPRFYRDIAFGGSIGAGEAYIQGYWACDDLEDLLRVLIRNRDVLEKMDSGLGRLGAPMRKLLHTLNRNTRAGSRKNIAAHYDLGNDIYELWLDRTRMYSSANFD